MHLQIVLDNLAIKYTTVDRTFEWNSDIFAGKLGGVSGRMEVVSEVSSERVSWLSADGEPDLYTCYRLD